jgi:2-phosphoglycerate kinase
MAIVVKRDGSTQLFEKEKLLRSLRKAGVDEETAWEIAAGIEFDVADEDIESGVIRDMVTNELEYYKPEVKRRYSTINS